MLQSNVTTDTATRAQAFRKQLSERVMVADGAMGTMLYSTGIFINRCFDELNLSAPDMVREIHQEYVKAGAEILETNTFGANRAAAGRLRPGREAARPSTTPACAWRARPPASDGLRGRRHGPARRAHRAARPDVVRRSARGLPRAGRGAARGRAWTC